jgi:hypothetical protein
MTKHRYSTMGKTLTTTLTTTLTLKRAKELAKHGLGGRLPRCGYEYIIFDNGQYTLRLMNLSGKFSLSEVVRPFCSDWEDQQAADIVSKL